ncbi:hypothetical protein H0H93_006450 [Arthromyces matolae]|nr:hypothetical protein H0H93_006450 [Arthromyces matolae]
MAAIPLFAKSYPAIYQALASGEPISCTVADTVFEGVSAPVAVVMDFFCLAELKVTRALTGNLPIISWITGGSPTLLRFWGPQSMGGIGDQSARIQEEVARTGRAASEVADEVGYANTFSLGTLTNLRHPQIYNHTDGTLIQIPGVPPMYDYEFFPQKLPFEMPLSLIINAGQEFLKESNAMLIASSDAYEEHSLDALRAWQSLEQKPVYTIGPLLPFALASSQSDVNQDNIGIAAFLDNALNHSGEHSVVFISFGTSFWPTLPDYLEEVVESLIEYKFPFILAHASPFAQVSVELSRKIQASGIGLLTPWSPQQFILNHPSTGWFLTHGGHGGITESLACGVPLICWPFSADQPAAAAHITENLKVGFELFEVRTGRGLEALYRTRKAPSGNRHAVQAEIRRVLDACRSEEGVQIRRNAHRLMNELRSTWSETGPARLALRDFIRTFVVV